ncbi:MAG: dioxygenase [Nostocoides sp.]
MSTPVIYLSHGAPPLADDARWTAELASWSDSIARPRAVLMVSAHWETSPIALSSTRPGTPLVYDFWGFPRHYYEVTYAAPPAPEVAASVERLLTDAGVHVARDQARGLDHGAYVPLVEMYPAADVPVIQLSLPTLQPEALLTVGSVLAPLRAEGVLIVGSGFTTHNLSWFRPGSSPDSTPPTASSEFDQWAKERVADGDVDALVNMLTVAPSGRHAHPRTEHWAPLYVALGAAYGANGSAGDVRGRSIIDGFWFGLSKRSWQFGS